MNGVNKNIYDRIKYNLLTTPHSSAIHTTHLGSLSFFDLNEQINYTINVLSQAGISRESRVAVILPQGPQMAITCLAVSCISSCVPLNPDYTSIEFKQLFSTLGVTALITQSGVCDQVLTLAKEINLSVFTLDGKKDQTAGTFKLGILKSRNATSQKSKPLEFSTSDDIAFVLHTSGSTSAPKVVPLTHQNIIASVDNLASSLNLSSNDVCLNMMPLYHVGALVDLLIAPLSVGGSVICATNMSAKTFFELTEEFKPTWYQGVPAMLRDIASESNQDNRKAYNNNFRFIRSVSAPLPGKTYDLLEKVFEVPVIEIYGMSETSGLITSNTLSPSGRKKGSVGRVDRTEVIILDESGNSSKPEKKGEIIVCGENVISGYEASREINESAFLGKCLKTGDEGYFDNEGFLFITGRLKEIINRGGEKISPREIDDVLLSCPEIKDAAAFPISHETLGEEVAAAIVLAKSSQLTDSTIITYCSQQLAYFKIPRIIYFRDKLPRTSGGKLKRHELQQLYDASNIPQSDSQYRKPENDLERALVDLWEKILKVKNIGLDDNFFDLGGDSLSAFTFIHDLHEKMHIQIQVSVLFNSPTIGELESHLRNNAEFEVDNNIRNKFLPGNVYQQLTKYMAGWQGERWHEDSLIVGKNTLGTKKPLFWIVNGYGEFEQLAKHIGHNQPIYGMRTLYETGLKSIENNQALSQQYVSELRDIQAQGPYNIGGYCEGANIAFEMARLLEKEGETISLLAMQDKFIPTPYDGRVAFFFSNSGQHSPYVFNDQPEYGWSKFYSGQLSLTRYPCEHVDFYSESTIHKFSKDLATEIEYATSGINSKSELVCVKMQCFSDQDYRCKISANTSRFMEPGEKRTLFVCIKNKSQSEWQPTAKSGLKLISRWKNMTGGYWGRLDAVALLENSVLPGDTLTIPLRITAPASSKILEIDMLEDGITLFQDKDSKPFRKLMGVFPGANKLKWLTNRNQRENIDV